MFPFPRWHPALAQGFGKTLPTPCCRFKMLSFITDGRGGGSDAADPDPASLESTDRRSWEHPQLPWDAAEPIAPAQCSVSIPAHCRGQTRLCLEHPQSRFLRSPKY